MKYLFTTANKIFAICIALLFVSKGLNAQNETQSIYSKYGVGLVNSWGYNGNQGMSGFGYAWRPHNYKPVIYDSLARSSAQLGDRRSNFINPMNPASYSNLSLTVFEAGIFSNNVQAASSGQTQQYNNAQLSHVALAFPIAKKWGAGFGLRPFSFRGYDYSNSSFVNNQSVEYSYKGFGGLNQLYASTAKEFGSRLSIGLTMSYIFGNKTDEKRVIYDNSSINGFFNTLEESEMRVSDLYIESGLQYTTQLNDNYRIVVGLKVSPQSSLSATQQVLVQSYTGDPDVEDFKDTISYVSPKKSQVAIAPTYGAGVSIEKEGKWMLGLDYSLQGWGDQKVSSGEANLVNNHRIVLGYEKFNNLTAFGSYFKQMGYRAGAHYNSSLVKVNGEDVNEFGISFGVCLPLRKSFSTINLAIEIGRRGIDEKQLIEENYLNIHFGVTINDRWFLQRKYD